MIRRPPRSTQSSSSAASEVYKRQCLGLVPREVIPPAGWISDAFPFVHAVRFFTSSLYDASPWAGVGREAAWLIGLGLVFAAAGGGSLLGAACAAPLARRIGPGPAVILGTPFGAGAGLPLRRLEAEAATWESIRMALSSVGTGCARARPAIAPQQP